MQSQFSTFLPTRKDPPCLDTVNPHPYCLPQATTHLCSISTDVPLLECQNNGVIKLVVSDVWLFIQHNVILRYIHIVVCVKNLFLLLQNSVLLYGYITFCLAIHHFIDLGIVSAGVNKAAVTICKQTLAFGRETVIRLQAQCEGPSFATWLAQVIGRVVYKY